MRNVRRLAVVVLLALVAAACGEAENEPREVFDAVDAARGEPYRYVYIDERPDARIEVRGLVEDDFRYKARLTVDGSETLDEVVRDDAIAVRFLDADAIGDYVDEAARGQVDDETSVEGVDTLSVLATGRWVIDRVGAPSLTAAERGQADPEKRDPVFESFSVFNYVKSAVNQSAGVVEYSAEAFNPTYKSSEDLFPAPEEGSGVVRYDLARPSLPTVADITASANPTFPETRHFRKMAIYVKDGRLVRVIERVEVIGSALNGFVDFLTSAFEEFGAPPEVIAEIRALSDQAKSASTEEQVEISKELLTGLNFGLGIGGAEPILIRTMDFELRDFGDPTITVEIPTGDDTATGTLAVLRGRGLKPTGTGTAEEPTGTAGGATETQE